MSRRHPYPRPYWGLPRPRRIPRPLLPRLGLRWAPVRLCPPCGSRTPTPKSHRSSLPSCGRAGPELTTLGLAGAGSEATEPTPPASDGPLQPPPSCGLAPAQAKRETKGRGAAASRPPPRSACALRLRARVSFGPAWITPFGGGRGVEREGLKSEEGLSTERGYGSKRTSGCSADPSCVHKAHRRNARIG